MIILKTVVDLKNHLQQQKLEGKSIGFIPTMGALHKGHESLIKLSKADGNHTVCSIFVNPTQFNNPEDLAKYPSTVDKDTALLQATNCDALFLPSVEEIYPQGTELKKKYALGHLEEVLEGEFRPGHFQGVCQVVHRLLDVVEPDIMYLGRKDFQQCLVIKKLIELVGAKTELVMGPTQREADGLAMSSRNQRIAKDDREEAVGIYEAMYYMVTHLPKKPHTEEEFDALKSKGKDHIEDCGFDPIDYFEICNANTGKPLRKWDGATKIVVAAAAYKGDVRLIDNMELN
jgi:pantoate--beta-alanine ligase